jgi:hypothetical protein
MTEPEELEQLQMIEWTFSYNDGLSFSANLKKLLQLLAFKNLEFISNQKNTSNNKYIVHTITWTGAVTYVKYHLADSLKTFKVKLHEYAESTESLETLTYEFKISRLLIKEHLLKNNIDDMLMLDANPLVPVHYNYQAVPHEVRYDECELTDNAIAEIRQHADLRNIYLHHLNDYLSIEIEKLELKPLELKINLEEKNAKKELQLLEVWIGLKEAGFLNHLDTNDYSKHRKSFFELFALTDRNYNSRNKDIKKRKEPVAKFLSQMANLLSKYHKKKI